MNRDWHACQDPLRSSCIVPFIMRWTMTADEILMDVEERMEKAIDVSSTRWPAFAPAGPTRAWSIRCGSRSTARRRR